MATNYLADSYADQQITLPWSVAGTFIRPFKFSLANTTGAVGFVVNDTLKLCPIPYKDGGYGVLVLGYHVEIPSLDTGTAVRCDLGDTNAASNAFQATYVSAAGVGINAAGVLNPLMCFSGTTAVAPVRGVVPKQYLASAVYTTQGNTFPVVDFVLKISTGPTTATTSGIIKGYLLMQTLNQSSQTF